jgi:hypothetical protein
MEFKEFGKIPRLSKDCVITEKIDGTNACVFIDDNGTFLTGSRTQWITPQNDNFGFSRWAHENKDELLKLGKGQHFGEWFGQGIQRNYGLKEKRFYLFNTHLWTDDLVRPKCCGVVPILYSGIFKELEVIDALYKLELLGSKAVSGFMKPEGVVIYHTAAKRYFKKTIEKDDEPKSKK